MINLLLTAGVSGQTANTNIRLGPEGEIMAWLVLGPLPNPGQHHENCEGFSRDYLQTESQASPDEIDTVNIDGAQHTWTLHLSNAADGLNFRGIFMQFHPVPGVAYAYTNIHSENTQQARILLGSDDGVKVWLNGTQVHENHLARGVMRDEDQIDVTLRAGTNRLLFKVDQADGGWGLLARIVNMDGTPATDLFCRLNLTVGPLEVRSPAGVRYLRVARGDTGSIDVHSALQFDHWEAMADNWVNRLLDVADDPVRLQNVINDADEKVQDAMTEGADVLSEALAEGARLIEDDYHRARDTFFTEMQNPEPLYDVNPQMEDFITVMPGGRHFQHADGRPFIPIGYNHNPDWPKTYESHPMHNNYNPEITRRFFEYLQNKGVNLLRLMIEAPLPSRYMEDPVGTFIPEHTRWIDTIVEFARQYDIKLMITPWDTFWMHHTWERNTFNVENGGPVRNRVDFLSHPEVMEAQKKRLKYMIDRWGNSGVIFSWELMNEIDIWWTNDQNIMTAWADEMISYVREYQMERWGRNHLISISTAAPMPSGTLGDLAYRRDDLDFATTHLYIGASRAPRDAIEPALAIGRGVAFSLNALNDSRPYFDSENGPIDNWISDQAFDDEVFHHMTWAHFAAGGAGSGLRWPYRHPHHLSDGMYDHLSRFKKFVDEVPWSRITGPYSDGPSVDAGDGAIAFTSGGKQAGIVWFASRDGNPVTQIHLMLDWPEGPENIDYRAFDTLTGEWIGQGSFTLAEGLVLTDAPSSMALILEGEGQ